MCICVCVGQRENSGAEDAGNAEWGRLARGSKAVISIFDVMPSCHSRVAYSPRNRQCRQCMHMLLQLPVMEMMSIEGGGFISGVKVQCMRDV